MPSMLGSLKYGVIGNFIHRGLKLNHHPKSAMWGTHLTSEF